MSDDAVPGVELAAAARIAAAEVERMHSNVARLLHNVGDPSKCRGCGAPIFWIRHRSGAIGIYNPDGSTHWGTCPDAKKFR